MTQIIMSSARITIMRVPIMRVPILHIPILHIPGAAFSAGRQGEADVTAVALHEQHAPPPSGSGSGSGSATGSGTGSGSGSGSGNTEEHNPFAPPPKGSPEQPWQPRLPADQPGQQPQPPFGGSHPPSGGPGGSDDSGAGPRFDMTDPAQRRARYALLAGMWGLFFGLFNLPEMALLLGALALYWGISSLCAKPKEEAEEGTGTGTGMGRSEVLAAMQSGPPREVGRAGRGAASPYVRAQDQRNPQFTAAVSGIVSGLLALAIVAVTFTFQIAYKNYYSCVSNALTQPARASCNNLLPEQLQSVIGTQG
jgi:hypothetical protein